jgi:putative membrane protein
MSYADLVHVNASLNSTSTFLLILGFIFIRQHKITAHRICMVMAFIASTLFLISYLVYHANHPSVPFAGQGFVRLIYYPILFTHIILAAIILPLIGFTFMRAFKGEFAKHRRVARWTLPLWLYVSITGVIVYLMLYHLYPPH